MVPKLVRTEVLDKGFGPLIYLLAGFLTILQENYLKHKLNSLFSIISLWDLIFFFEQHPLPLRLLFSLSLSLSLLFLSVLSTPFHCLLSFPLYSLSLVGFKSLLFHQFPCNPTVTHNPKKQSCLLRILLKLFPDLK